MKNLHWYIDTSIVMDMGDDKCWRLNRAMQKYDHTFTEYKPFTESELGIQPSRLNLVYGSHNFIQQMQRAFGDVVTSYCDSERLRVSSYYSDLPNEWLLNGDGFLCTLEMLNTRVEWLFEKFETEFLFLRPDSGFKTFIPAVLFKGTWKRDLEDVKRKYRVSPYCLCLIAPACNLSGEARHFVVGEEVVSSSWYKPKQVCFGKGPESLRQDEERMLALAERVAKFGRRPQSCYTVDTCLVGGEVKVVELNSFSCAGLYDCDYEKVFDAVTKKAIEEYEES